ncbi:MAG: flagellar protein FliS [Ignavibacteria bacterium]|jgi:flagellar protein FliS|nr:flagellar protein FliS [Ignavibacteria bacterium]
MHNQRANQYVINEILSASPEQLIMKVFSFAIVNCQKKNMIKTNEALQVLIDALDFDNPAAKEICIGFYRIYRYCQEQMRKKNYDIVLKTLTDLKETWETALQNR